METYRIYCTDGVGTIDLADWFEAEDDGDAIWKARTFKSGILKCEIWQGTRMVAGLGAQGLRSAG